jgi:DNA-binding winged helix-turn-helix (wHTH) protein/tetratricopeptide (TPR) repeat protein
MRVHPGIASFHPFSFDLESGRLSMRGHAVHIPEQNARLLSFLILKTGRLATREELQSVLWPENAPYDTQQAINKAISQLRTALNDTSTKSGFRYIETIPRRGYRFCAEFRILPAPEPPQRPAPPQPRSTEPIILNGEDGLALQAAQPPAPSLALERNDAGNEAAVLPAQTRSPHLAFALACAALLAIASTAVFAWKHYHPRTPPPSPALRSIGVPPMEAVGPGADALAESFRLDLTESLAQLPQLKVLSVHAFTSSPRDKGDLTELARAQKADLLLLGRFEVANGRYYLAFELVRNTDASHLASFHYDGTPEQLHSILTRLQEDVFTRLKLSNSGEAPIKTTTPEAYQAYLQGRHFLIERTDEALNKSIAQFKHAIDLDPNFAKAYAGLASAYLILASHRSFPDGYQMSRGLAMHALELDPLQAEAHALLGCIAMSKDWDTQTSEAELQRSIELDPDEASFHIWLATTYNFEGRFKESLQQIDLAKQEDPYWPPVYQSEVLAAANAGDKKRVLAAAQTLLKLTPGWPMAHNAVASALWNVGRYPEAVAEWRTMYALDNDQQGIQLEDQGLQALRSKGPSAYARLHMENAKLVAGTDQAFAPLAVAEWSAEAGERNAALAILQTMIARHDPSAVTIGIDPAFSSLRTDHRFSNLLTQSGLSLRH